MAAGDSSVARFAKSAFDSFESMTKQLVDSQQLYSEFSALREESVSLAQRLRELAFQMLKTSTKPDECPLCHTSFDKDNLAKHINADLDQQLEAKAAELLKAIRDNELKAKDSEKVLKTALWAEQACKRFEEPASITVSRLLQLIFDSQNECSALILSLNQINDSLANFNSNGMTVDRYRELSELVSAQIGKISLEEIKEIFAKQEIEKREKSTEREQLRRGIQEIQSKLSMTLAFSDQTSNSIESILSQLKERLVTTVSHLSKIEPYLALLPWSAQQPLSELVLTINTVRQVAGDYQQTFSKEQSSVKMLTEASSRKIQIEVHLAGLVPRIERFSQARGVLSKIQNEYSLPGAMKQALEQNRTAIEAIFARIHSPAEFSGLGSSLTTLVRKSDGGTSTLQQISTGQRAAYALSLFLAQNAQLRTAPPLILIDDPIAHVDDLNCLSFLDYLREIVIAGERQVVFATANDKLAALFERKFDFLESDFRRYDLVR